MSTLESNISAAGTLWTNNPVLVQLLGLSPVLAVSTTLSLGISLGVATAFVCLLSCVTVSMLKQYIPLKWRLFWFMVIIASFTTLADTVMQLYFYRLSLEIGIYIPLICCNIAILSRIEIVAVTSDLRASVTDSISTGLGFMLAIVLFASCRELLISGTLLSDYQLLLPASDFSNVGDMEETGTVFSFAETPAGALILLGLLVAMTNVIREYFGSMTTTNSNEIVPVQRARVTGKLNQRAEKE